MDGGERWAVGVDVGGTFVDVAAVSSTGRSLAFKRALDERGPLSAIVAALEKLERQGAAPERVERLLHGTTVVTNALLERRHPPVGMLLTSGFRDVPALGRQSRRELYARRIPVQTPLEIFPDELRHEVAERTGADGEVIRPLDEAAVARAGTALVQAGVRAVAICFLHAHVNPSHERRAREVLASVAPDLQVSLSSDVDPAPREYERALATALDAYAKGAAATYIGALATDLSRRNFREPLLMSSAGGVVPAAECLARPILLAMSGPAAAANGAVSFLDEEARRSVAISIDVGGTTSDIALLEKGVPGMADETTVGTLAVRLGSIDVTSIAVGGGSVLRVNEAGGLRLGPQSMGAFPGPAGFGRGGLRPTLADAFLVAGFLPDRLAGGLVLSRSRAAEAIGRELAAALREPVESTAAAAIRVANTMLAEAVKRASLARGCDPRQATLVAAGGAGGLHAAEVARIVGARRVLVPPTPGVLAAWGLLGSPLLSTWRKAVDCPLEAPMLTACVRKLRDAAEARPLLAAYETPEIEVLVDVCYEGQEFSLPVPYEPEVDAVQDLATRFHALHARVRGQALRPALRARGVRLVRRQRAPEVTFSPARGGTVRESMRRVLAPDPVQCPVVSRQSIEAAGSGPLIVEGDDATIWIPDGWRWRGLAGGALLLEAQ